jgi:Tfp pilus assembly protein PilN
VHAVNLLPSKKEARDRRRQPNVAALGGIVAAVAVSAVMAMWFLNASGAVTERQSEVDNLRAELGAIPTPAPRDTSGDALESEKTARLDALAAALSTRVAWDRVLREISLVTPDDVWFMSLQATSPTASTGAAPAPEATASGGGLSITGRTFSHDAVARLLARLALVPDLDQVKLEKSVLATTDGRTLVEFTIAAAIRGNGASS